MLSPEVIKQISKQARGSKAGPDKDSIRQAASKASARKIMNAIKNDDEEAFLQAFSEMRETYGHDSSESED